MTHLECACTKNEKPSSIGKTTWTPWRRSVTWQKPVPHSIKQQARRYQSREVRAKNYNVGELVLRLPDKKKDKLKTKWEGPFIIDQVLTGGAYRLRDASDNRLEPNPWNAARLRRFYA